MSTVPADRAVDSNTTASYSGGTLQLLDAMDECLEPGVRIQDIMQLSSTVIQYRRVLTMKKV